jgi:hypothetical protein
MKFTAKNIRVYLHDEQLNIDVSMIAECPIKMINVPITITRSNKMEYQKDCSLLRPFDLEAAKRGEKILTSTFIKCEFRGALSNGSVILVEFDDQSGGEREHGRLLMSPLCWVEGSPVYKGDVLYNRLNDNKVVFDHMCAACNVESTFTWQKPKTKREGWIEVGPIKYHKTKEDAERNRSISCHIVFAQWEE